MHEMGIALQIIEIAAGAIPANMKGTPIGKVNLRVGKLSAVVPASLRFCFDIAAKDTPLAGAELHIEEIPVVARCKDCEHRFTITEAVFTCARCGSGSLEILSGRELDIVSLEVAEDAP